MVEVIRISRTPLPGFAGYDPSAIRYLFFAVALALLVMARVGRARILATPGLARSPAPAAMAQRLQTATLVSLANGEAIAVLGFVLFVLGGNRRDFYALLTLSALGFI